MPGISRLDLKGGAPGRSPSPAQTEIIDLDKDKDITMHKFEVKVKDFAFPPSPICQPQKDRHHSTGLTQPNKQSAYTIGVIPALEIWDPRQYMAEFHFCMVKHSKQCDSPTSEERNYAIPGKILRRLLSIGFLTQQDLADLTSLDYASLAAYDNYRLRHPYPSRPVRMLNECDHDQPPSKEQREEWVQLYRPLYAVNRWAVREEWRLYAQRQVDKDVMVTAKLLDVSEDGAGDVILGKRIGPCDPDNSSPATCKFRIISTNHPVVLPTQYPAQPTLNEPYMLAKENLLRMPVGTMLRKK
jgi:hypothetical protein